MYDFFLYIIFIVIITIKLFLFVDGVECYLKSDLDKYAFIFRGVLLLTQCSLSCESSVHDQRKLLSRILQENISWEKKPFIRGYEFLTSMLMHISCLLTCFHSPSIPKSHIFKLYQMVNQLSPDVPSQKNHDWTESSAQTNTIRKVSAD